MRDKKYEHFIANPNADSGFKEKRLPEIQAAFFIKFKD